MTTLQAVETYKPFEKQVDFHSCPAKFRLFGGAAGPGKSRAILEEAIQQSLEVAGADTLVLRRTFAELEESIIGPFRRMNYRDMGGKFNESKHLVTWKNGSTTRFGYCRSEKDVYQYQGAEFLFIGIDELTLFTYKMWAFLTSRNRCPIKQYTAGVNKGLPVVPCMAGASNPGNVGHQWVKDLFIDKVPTAQMDEMERRAFDPQDYAFVQAFVWDNPIYANDEVYLKTLRSLPTHLRRAFLDGDWNVFAGQYFDVFDRAKHTAWIKSDRLKPYGKRWISIDWGFDHPSAVYWHYQEGTRTITYKEFVQNNLSPRMLGQAIIDKMERDENGKISEKITEVFLGGDAFDEHSWGENSIADMLGDVLAEKGIPRPARADNARVDGWQLMYQLLETDNWTISSACTKLIEILPTLTRDPDKTEDILKIDGDDPADSARYGLKSKLAPGKKPIEVRVAERVDVIRESNPQMGPTDEMMMAAKIRSEEMRKKTPKRFFGSRFSPHRHTN